MADLRTVVDGWILEWGHPSDSEATLLYCFPHSGGSASFFSPWPRSLGPEVQVCGLQLPGRGARLREPPIKPLPELVDQVARVMEVHSAGRPFAVFGHSSGAIIALETLRTLFGRGICGGRRLFASGAPAPEDWSDRSSLSRLSDDALKVQLGRFAGTPKALLEDREFMALALPAIRSDLALVENHEHHVEPRLPCPISAYGGKEDVRTTRNDLLAWAPYSSAGAFVCEVFPGGHFYLQDVAGVAAAIKRDLGLEGSAGPA